MIKKHSGFTLIEILITMTIFISLFLVITRFSLDISSFSSFFEESLVAQQELQISLRSMVREIRSMGPSSNGSYPIMSASASSFTFYSDSDGDGLFERIRYYTEDNIFKKGVIKPTGSPLTYDPAQEKTFELVHNVTNGTAVFFYYDKDYVGSGSPLAFPVDVVAVKLIKTEVIVDQNPNALPGPISFVITAMIRNFKQQ